MPTPQPRPEEKSSSPVSAPPAAAPPEMGRGDGSLLRRRAVLLRPGDYEGQTELFEPGHFESPLNPAFERPADPNAKAPARSKVDTTDPYGDKRKAKTSRAALDPTYRSPIGSPTIELTPEEAAAKPPRDPSQEHPRQPDAIGAASEGTIVSTDWTGDTVSMTSSTEAGETTAADGSGRRTATRRKVAADLKRKQLSMTVGRKAHETTMTADGRLVDGPESTDRAMTVGVGEKGFQLGADASSTRAVREAGPPGPATAPVDTLTTSGGAAVEVRGDGVKGSLHAGRTFKSKDKSSLAVAGNASFDSGTGEMAGGFRTTYTTSKGRRFGIGGNVSLVNRDDHQKSGGTLDVEVMGVKIVSGGGREFRIHEVAKRTDDTFVVVIETTTTETDGGGYGVIDQRSEDKQSTRRTVPFATRKEAEAFRKEALESPQEAVQKALPEDAEGAAGMKQGETIEQRESETRSDGVGVPMGTFDVGFVSSTCKRLDIRVYRASDDYVDVDVERGVLESSGFNLSSAGGGMNIGSSVDTAETLKVRIYFKSHPEVFRRFMASRGKTLPKGEGAIVLGVGKRRRETDTVAASVAGIAYGKAGYLETGEHEDQDGHKTEYALGGQKETLDVPLIGGLDRTNELNITEMEGGPTLHSATTRIADSRAEDTAPAVARATDTHKNIDARGKAAGAWKITTVFDDVAMDNFVEAARSGAIGEDWELYGKAPGKKLEAALRIAGNNPKVIRVALTQFVKEAGEDGLRLIRKYGRGERDDVAEKGSAQQYVELEGDPVFPGLKGHVQLQTRIAELWTELNAEDVDGRAVLGRAMKLRQAQQKRRDAMMRVVRYRELPEELRQREIDRVETFIGQLREVEAEARKLAEDDHRRKVEQLAEGKRADHADAQRVFMPEPLTEGVTEKQNVDCEVYDAPSDKQLERELRGESPEAKGETAFEKAERTYRDQQKRLQATKREFNQVYYLVHRIQYQHIPEVDRRPDVYVDVEEMVASGDRRIDSARRHEGLAETLAQSARAGFLAENVGRASDELDAAIHQVRMAMTSHRSAIAVYRAIEAFGTGTLRKPNAPPVPFPDAQGDQ